jgi:hypothetical protein
MKDKITIQVRPNIHLQQFRELFLEYFEFLRADYGLDRGYQVIAADLDALPGSFATKDKIFPVIKAGALGYLLTDSDPAELVTLASRTQATLYALREGLASLKDADLDHPEADE